MAEFDLMGINSLRGLSFFKGTKNYAHSPLSN